MKTGILTLLLVVAGTGIPSPPQQASDAPMVEFLKRTVELNASQMAALEAGEVVTKQLPADEKADVAVFGAVRIAASPESYVERFRDIAALRRSGTATEVGKFADAPDIRDLSGLTLDDEDFAAARKCRPGKCDIKLARTAIERMHAGINWSAPDARSRAAAVLRQVLVDFVVTYRRGGAKELATYLDKEHPVDASKEFGVLLDSTRYLISYVPEFHRYISNYPAGKLEGVEDFFYWIKETGGPKPTVSVFHVSIWRDPRGPILISSKQIYASHFVRVGLGLVALIPSSPGAKDFYLLNLYRGRIDPPGGLIGSALIGKIRGSVLNNLREELKSGKARTLAQP